MNFFSKYIGLLGFFYFKLFICPSGVKKSKSFKGLTPWTSAKAPLWIRCWVYRSSPAIYNIWKLNLSSKTDISRTAWIYPCMPVFFLKEKLHVSSLKLYLKREMFSCEFCEIYKNTSGRLLLCQAWFGVGEGEGK